MKRSAFGHTKLKKLSQALQLEDWGAIGVLESLWHLTARQAPCGDIGRLANEDIAVGIGWSADAGELVAALVCCGWVDEHPEHRLVIHDWHEHADDAVKKAIARNKLRFASLPSAPAPGVATCLACQ